MRKYFGRIHIDPWVTVSDSIGDRDRWWLFLRFTVISPDDDPARVIEHFNHYFENNYNTSPAFFVGTLKQAVNEAFLPDASGDVRFILSRCSQRCQKILLGPSTADLSSSRQKCIQQYFLFGDLLQRNHSRISSGELHRLALGCHFTDEQWQVRTNRQK